MTDQLTMPLPAPTRLGKFPTEPIMRAADIEGPYRYVMRRDWGSGPRALWCLLNPSDADATKDDPTTKRMMGWAYRWGFGGMIVVNPYPFIASKPADMEKWRKSIGEGDHGSLEAWLENIDIVRDELAKAEVHIAGWGAGMDQEDLKGFLEEIETTYPDLRFHEPKRTPIAWQCLGHTVGGHPIHPLARGSNRVPDDAKLIPWRRP